DVHDAIIGYLLIGTDNTARQQVEEERQKLDQRLRDQHFYTRSLIESNIDALMATDPRGIITDVNKQTEALTGCTRDELIGAPLNALIGFSEVLGNGLMGPMTDQQRGYIGDIFRSGKHLLSLINDILDLSKVEAGKMLLDLEPVQVSSLFVNSLSVVKGKAAA